MSWLLHMMCESYAGVTVEVLLPVNFSFTPQFFCLVHDLSVSKNLVFWSQEVNWILFLRPSPTVASPPSPGGLSMYFRIDIWFLLLQFLKTCPQKVFESEVHEYILMMLIIIFGSCSKASINTYFWGVVRIWPGMVTVLFRWQLLFKSMALHN